MFWIKGTYRSVHSDLHPFFIHQRISRKEVWSHCNVFKELVTLLPNFEQMTGNNIGKRGLAESVIFICKKMCIVSLKHGLCHLKQAFCIQKVIFFWLLSFSFIPYFIIIIKRLMADTEENGNRVYRNCLIFGNFSVMKE